MSKQPRTKIAGKAPKKGTPEEDTTPHERRKHGHEGEPTPAHPAPGTGSQHSGHGTEKQDFTPPITKPGSDYNE